MLTQTARLDQAAGDLPLTVKLCTDGAQWDSFVAAQPQATGYHLWGWRDVFIRVFGHEAMYLTALRGDEVVGVLPLVSFRSLLFGRFLVSLPFVNYGGVVADDQVAAETLVSRAGSLAREMSASHVELRHTARRFEALMPKAHKVAMLLALPDSTDAMWTALDRKVRNQVRKAEKSGLVAEVSGADALDVFYEVFAHNMRDLGTPVYPKQFFAAVLGGFPERTRLIVVRHQRQPVAAALTWAWRDTVEVPWASSLRSYNAAAPNNLLYWTVIQEAISSGARRLDFGRSTPNEGTFHFKRQWGAEPLPLCWEYDIVSGQLPDQSPKNPKFQMAIHLWQRLPLPVANLLGPMIVRSIP